MFGSTNAIAQVINNQNVTINENGVYIPEKNYTGFGIVTVDVASSPTDNIKTYSLYTVIEKLNEILYSKTTKTNKIAQNILGTEQTFEDVEETYEYLPTNIAEVYQEILTNDHLCVQNTLKEILGEN